MNKIRTISFFSAPGGVGKTTIALCLSWFLRERNFTPLLIDLDPSLGLTLNLRNFRDYKKDIDDKARTSADLLEKTIDGVDSRTFDFRYYISNASFQRIPLDFIASSIRLEDVMGKIWHTTTAGHSEKKLRQALNLIPIDLNYDFIILDNIPCYGLTYALTSLFASDICIVPLRLTYNDLGRTIGMIRKLQETAEKYELSEEDFSKKLYFLFNRVETQYKREGKIPEYRKEILDEFPKATIFNKYVGNQVGFTRIGTKEEMASDSRNVKRIFNIFYEEFEKKLMR